MSPSRILPAAAFTLLSMLACVIPGVGVPGAPPLDASSLPTIVVLTANAAMTQTATAAPAPPTATHPAPGALETLPNGSAKFIDTTAGYEITFPTGWLTLRPNSEEFYAALGSTATHNPSLLDQMQLDLTKYDPALDRLLSYPLRPDLLKDDLFGFSGVHWDPQDETLISEANMGEFLRDLEASGGIPGFHANTAQVYENAQKVMVIEVGGPFSIGDGQGGLIPFYLTAVFFKPTPASTVLLTVTYLKNVQTELAPDVIAIVDSIRLLL